MTKFPVTFTIDDLINKVILEPSENEAYIGLPESRDVTINDAKWAALRILKSTNPDGINCTIFSVADGSQNYTARFPANSIDAIRALDWKVFGITLP